MSTNPQLVALTFAPNNCYTQVKTLEEACVHVANGQWRMSGSHGTRYPINAARYIRPGHRYGVIGVFDTTFLGLNAMVHAAREATANHNGDD